MKIIGVGFESKKELSQKQYNCIMNWSRDDSYMRFIVNVFYNRYREKEEMYRAIGRGFNGIITLQNVRFLEQMRNKYDHVVVLKPSPSPAYIYDGEDVLDIGNEERRYFVLYEGWITGYKTLVGKEDNKMDFSLHKPIPVFIPVFINEKNIDLIYNKLMERKQNIKNGKEEILLITLVGIDKLWEKADEKTKEKILKIIDIVSDKKGNIDFKLTGAIKLSTLKEIVIEYFNRYHKLLSINIGPSNLCLPLFDDLPNTKENVFWKNFPFTSSSLIQYDYIIRFKEEHPELASKISYFDEMEKFVKNKGVNGKRNNNAQKNNNAKRNNRIIYVNNTEEYVYSPYFYYKVNGRLPEKIHLKYFLSPYDFHIFVNERKDLFDDFINLLTKSIKEHYNKNGSLPLTFFSAMLTLPPEMLEVYIDHFSNEIKEIVIPRLFKIMMMATNPLVNTYMLRFVDKYEQYIDNDLISIYKKIMIKGYDYKKEEDKPELMLRPTKMVPQEELDRLIKKHLENNVNLEK